MFDKQQKTQNILRVFFAVRFFFLFSCLVCTFVILPDIAYNLLNLVCVFTTLYNYMYIVYACGSDEDNDEQKKVWKETDKKRNQKMLNGKQRNNTIHNSVKQTNCKEKAR